MNCAKHWARLSRALARYGHPDTGAWTILAAKGGSIALCEEGRRSFLPVVWDLEGSEAQRTWVSGFYEGFGLEGEPKGVDGLTLLELLRTLRASGGKSGGQLPSLALYVAG